MQSWRCHLSPLFYLSNHLKFYSKQRTPCWQLILKGEALFETKKTSFNYVGKKLAFLVPTQPGMPSSDCKPASESLSSFFLPTPCKESSASHNSFVEQVEGDERGIRTKTGRKAREGEGGLGCAGGREETKDSGEPGASGSFLPAQWIRERIRFCISFQGCIMNGYRWRLETAPPICYHFCRAGVHSITRAPSQGLPG